MTTPDPPRVLKYRGEYLVPVNGVFVRHTKAEWDRYLKGVDRDASNQMSKPIESEED